MFSFGMFMYEVISLHFPFEKQNLMSSQIEKLVIDGERPPLQSRVSQSVQCVLHEARSATRSCSWRPGTSIPCSQLATRDKCTM